MKMIVRKCVRRFIAATPTPVARRLLYLSRFGKLPNVSGPSTFQEKLNVRVLYDRRPLLVTASSKVQSKRYVANKNVPGLEIPRTLWSGVDLNEVNGHDFGRPWVLKPSHRSGGVFLGEKSVFKLDDLPIPPEQLLEEREYRRSKLWAYKAAPRELLIEERIGEGTEPPVDYKFFVFDGAVRMIQVDSGRFGSHARVLYSPDWVPRPETFVVPRGIPDPRPAKLDDMTKIAELLGTDFDFVRVDLYLVGENVYFGELTVYPGGGLSPWPTELDNEIGSYWHLPPSLGPMRRRKLSGRL